MKKEKIAHYSGIGGQAVLEGVMMRNKGKFAVAVRRENGEIACETQEYKGFGEGTVFRKIPFVRGILVFIDSFILGMKSLNISSAYYIDEEEETPTKLDKAVDKVSGGHGEAIAETVTMIISFAFAIGLFVVLPYFLANWMATYVRNESLLSLFEGVLRILIFVLYILLISQMKDIKRLFMYHGAEHKCINCLEKGHPLTVENAMRSSRLHKRCGSSFILFVMFVSIILFFFIRTDVMWQRLLYRILLIPVISGISYELIRKAGTSENPVINLVSKPGLWLQKLTTKEPEAEMVEVAIHSVEAVFDWKQYLKDEFGVEPDE